ncbi:peptide ABC transporter permease [Agrobacterium tumefaciens]|uniref:Peptide ABC transporter permease n=2 Tax=Agrobacterium TaxID=357 RepID=A0A0D0K9U6_AGRTU|nr:MULTISPECIES: ABC transporter permease [Rhizobium/Agrobacterium group]KIQ05548.1 peptide ABC transporter permease [Agrobacterium tumefaciens]KAA3509645.1 ABC transporter permease [Agrobacterium rosae]KAA3516546.1 ABC transporter permease [Agrobacterium rosae]MBD8688816.1 ABC transporter permease [Rhizobium sp. CFBP 13644]MBD8694388.1 ABC transporter permease [Rhizobium sp. CFBP 13717]
MSISQTTSTPVPSHSLFKAARKVATSAIVILTTLLGLLVITFVVGRMVPADPVIAAIGDQADQATYDRVYKEMGLDRPIYVQFANYLGNAVQLDFGQSNITKQPVVNDLARVFPATLELATLATLIGAGLGVPLGVIAAVRKGTWVDHVARVVGLLGYSTPIFWLGTIVILLFYAQLGVIPPGGRIYVYNEGIVEARTNSVLIDSLLGGHWDVFWSALHHLIAPALILGYAAMAYLSRMTRSFMLEQLHQEYILTARAKGLGKRPIIWRHAFRNIRVQLLTVVALAYCGLLDGTVLIETVFAWPGLGQYLTSALFFADMNAVLGSVFLIGLISIAINFLSDIAYRFIDPRTR